MSEIVEGVKEALAIARGEIPAARIHHQGHAYVPEAEAKATIARLEAELERYRTLDRKADTYWIADDPEIGHTGWTDAIDDADAGEIREVWRGGTFEVIFCAHVYNSDECQTFIKEPTLEAAEAKVRALTQEKTDD